MISPNKSSDLTSQANKTDATHKNIHNRVDCTVHTAQTSIIPIYINTSKDLLFLSSIHLFSLHTSLYLRVYLRYSLSAVCCWCAWALSVPALSLPEGRIFASSLALLCLWAIFTIGSTQNERTFQVSGQMAYRKRNIYPAFQVWVIPLYIYRYSHFGIGLQQE